MHEGHRRRMIGKLLNKKEVLSDHEILEILLFYCIPRKNVNELAHRLLDAFGCLNNVINSEPETLCSVDGVGMKTAEFLVALSEGFKRAKETDVVFPELFSFESCKPVLKLAFKNMSSEVFMALFLDKKSKIIMRKIFCSHSHSIVEITLKELTRGIEYAKPEGVIICHNHLSGNVNPSSYDDEATLLIQQALSPFSIKLIDHIIVTNNDFYSYHSNRRLEALKGGK